MSQESLVSQTTLADSPIHAAIRLPARPPSGYERLPHEDDDSDVELCAMKPTSNTEASAVAIVSPFPSPEDRDIESSPQDGLHLPRMRISGLLKMFVILATCGLPAALYFSAVVWYVGGTVLKSIIAVPPYNSMDPVATVKASMAGAPIIALTVGAVVSLDFALRRLPRSSSRTDSRRTKYNRVSEILKVCAMCAPSSVFAMPLGFVMVPGLATEAFGAWHALAVSATGLSVCLAGYSLAIWCCVTVRL